MLRLDLEVIPLHVRHEVVLIGKKKLKNHFTSETILTNQFGIAQNQLQGINASNDGIIEIIALVERLHNLRPHLLEKLEA